jgi:ceramidase
VRAETHLTPGCPWWALSELRLPNVDWCEAQRCSWIVEPANTGSNLAYLIVGLALCWVARGSSSSQLRFFGPAALIVGFSSGIYHASYTFVLQILDFFAMYVFCYLLITVNLRRLGVLGAGTWRRWYWLLVAGTTALTVAIDFLEVPIQGIVFLLIVAIAASETWLWRRERGASHGLFLLALAFLTAGGVFSALDVTRTWCDPWHPYLQGHALWHVLSALCLFTAYFHYRQFGSGEAGTVLSS